MKLREIFKKLFSPPEEIVESSLEEKRIAANYKAGGSLYRYDQETDRHYWCDIRLPAMPVISSNPGIDLSVWVPDPHNKSNSPTFQFSHCRQSGREWSWRGDLLPTQPELAYGDDGDVRVIVRHPDYPERILYDRHEDKDGNKVFMEDNRPPYGAKGFEMDLRVYRIL